MIGIVGSEAAAAHVDGRRRQFATIDRKREDVVARVMELTGRRKVSTASSRSISHRTWRSTRRGAEGQRHRRLLFVEQQSAARASPSRAQSKGANLRFIRGFAFLSRPCRRGRCWRTPHPQASSPSPWRKPYPLAEIAQAHLDVEHGGNLGNIVVTV